MLAPKPVTVGPWTLGGPDLVLIAGPCVLEPPAVMNQVAEHLLRLSERLKLPLVFKASYSKDNRRDHSSYRGPGLEAGLEQLADLKRRYGLAITSDIHHPQEAAPAAQVLDLIQIPAYLGMQTSLLEAAAATGKPVNVKRPPFLSLKELDKPAAKLVASGATQVITTERGYINGYDDLVVDPRAFYAHRATGHPVVFDLTHSSKPLLPPRSKPAERLNFLLTMGRAGVAAGVHGLFIEAHPEPEKALCDGVCQVPVDELEALLRPLLAIHQATWANLPS